MSKQNSAHSASGKSTQERVSDTLLKTEDLSCIFPKEPETSVSGISIFDSENSKPKDSDGPLLGEDFIKKSKYPTLEKPKEPKPSKSKEPSKVSLLKLSRK